MNGNDNNSTLGASPAHDITTPDGWRRWVADLQKTIVPAALATLTELAANADSPVVRRSAERELRRYRARVAKASKAARVEVHAAAEAHQHARRISARYRGDAAEGCAVIPAHNLALDARDGAETTVSKQHDVNQSETAQTRALQLLTQLAELTCSDPEAVHQITRELDEMLASKAVSKAFVAATARSCWPASIARLQERVAAEQDPTVRAELRVVLRAHRPMVESVNRKRSERAC